MNNVDFYIKPLEGEPAFPICACFRCGMLSCGARNDWNSSNTTQYPWFSSQTIPLVIAGHYLRLTWPLVYYGFVHGYIGMGDVQQHCKKEAERGTVSAAVMSTILAPHSFSSFLTAVESLNQSDENKMSPADMEITWRLVYQVANLRIHDS